MSRGFGTVQRRVLAVVQANPDGVAIDDIVTALHGASASASQREAVRRAVRTLSRDGLVVRTVRWETRARKSLRRFVDIAPCPVGFCGLCGERKRRVRTTDWHRRVMRSNAKHDPAWLDDLAIAEASGFVHETASQQRLVTEQADAVDLCQRRVQIVSPASTSAPVR